MQEKLENTIRFVDFMRWQIFRNLKLNDLFSGTFPNQITQPSIRHICAVLNLLNVPTYAMLAYLTDLKLRKCCHLFGGKNQSKQFGIRFYSTSFQKSSD